MRSILNFCLKTVVGFLPFLAFSYFIAPIMWKQGSSSAFDLMLTVGLILLAIGCYTHTLAAIKYTEEKPK